MHLLRSNRSTGADTGVGGGVSQLRWGEWWCRCARLGLSSMGPQPVCWQRCQIKPFVGLWCKTYSFQFKYLIYLNVYLQASIMLMCVFIQTRFCVQTGIFLCFDGKDSVSSACKEGICFCICASF